jgi:hypothetical protein
VCFVIFVVDSDSPRCVLGAISADSVLVGCKNPFFRGEFKRLRVVGFVAVVSG